MKYKYPIVWLSLVLLLQAETRGESLRFFRLRAEEPLRVTSFCLAGGMQWEVTQANAWVTIEQSADLADDSAWVVYTRVRSPLRRLQWRTVLPSLPPEFQFVPAGSFTMGSPEDEPGHISRESQCEVTLNAFAMQRLPVTYAQWNAVRNWALDNQYPDLPAGQKGSHGDARNTEHDPVTQVNWFAVVKWLNARSELEGKTPVYTVNGAVYREGDHEPDWNQNVDGYRLPTEAEWEYAARAGTLTATYAPLAESAWYRENSQVGSEHQTHPVGQKQANSWGFHDMLGNVREWCWDRLAIYAARPLMNPTGATSGTHRVIRGGNYQLFADDCRAAARHAWYPAEGSRTFGFRPAMSVPTLEHHRRELTLSASVDFGGVWQGGTLFRDFWIENTGDHPLTVEGLSLPAGVAGSFSGTLAPGQREQILLTFTQEGAMGLSGTLSITSDANAGLERVELAGEALGVPPAPTGFVDLPGGTFHRGSPEDELGRNPGQSETMHSVALFRFAIQRAPVTWAQWNEVRDWALQNGYEIGAGQRGSHGDFRNTDTDPVTNISWHDAVKWLNAWSEREGLVYIYWNGAIPYKTGVVNNPLLRYANSGYRLPTEAEWEYAARAGTTTAFFTGPITSTDTDPVLGVAAWYGKNSDSKTHPVGGKQANAWGLYDLLGNVSEWCMDWSAGYPEEAQVSPRGPADGTNRIVRGGSYGNTPASLRAAARRSADPNTSGSSIGFRPVIQTLPTP